VSECNSRCVKAVPMPEQALRNLYYLQERFNKFDEDSNGWIEGKEIDSAVKETFEGLAQALLANEDLLKKRAEAMGTSVEEEREQWTELSSLNTSGPMFHSMRDDVLEDLDDDGNRKIDLREFTSFLLSIYAITVAPGSFE